MTAIQPLFDNVRIVTEAGTPTPEFKAYMDLLFARSGGTTGGSYQPLESGPAVAWDVDLAPVAFLVMTENPTITPVNLVAGDYRLYRLTLIQDAVGGRIPTFAGAFKHPGGVPPSVATAPNAVSEYWYSSDGTNLKLVADGLDLK